MTKRKKYNKPIMVPEAAERMQEIRYEIAKKLGYITINAEDWWDALTPIQKSEVNGIVTKLMVERAKQAMLEGKFKY